MVEGSRKLALDCVKHYSVLNDKYSSAAGTGAWVYRGAHHGLQPQKTHAAWLDLF